MYFWLSKQILFWYLIKTWIEDTVKIQRLSYNTEYYGLILKCFARNYLCQLCPLLTQIGWKASLLNFVFVKEKYGAKKLCLGLLVKTRFSINMHYNYHQSNSLWFFNRPRSFILKWMFFTWSCFLMFHFEKTRRKAVLSHRILPFYKSKSSIPLLISRNILNRFHFRDETDFRQFEMKCLAHQSFVCIRAYRSCISRLFFTNI